MNIISIKDPASKDEEAEKNHENIPLMGIDTSVSSFEEMDIIAGKPLALSPQTEGFQDSDLDSWMIVSQADKPDTDRQSSAFDSGCGNFFRYMVLWIWVSSDIPWSIWILSVLSFFTTTLVPVFIFEDCWIKLSMPFGLGMPALIWRARNDEELIEKKIEIENLGYILRSANIRIKRRDPKIPIEKVLLAINEQEFNKDIIHFIMGNNETVDDEDDDDDDDEYKIPDDILKMSYDIEARKSEHKIAKKKLEEQLEKKKSEELEKKEKNLRKLEYARCIEQMDETFKKIRGTFETYVTRVNNALFRIYTPKLYKVAESIMESTPQLLLQIYVVLVHPNAVQSSFGDFFAYVSLAISLLSNIYASSQMFFPASTKQLAYAFVMCFCDVTFRCGRILFLCVCAPTVYVLIGFSISLILFNLLQVSYLEKGHIWKEYFLYSILFAFVSSQSAATTYFILTSGMSMSFAEVRNFFKREVLFRLLITIASLLIGSIRFPEYYFASGSIALATVIMLVLLWKIPVVFNLSISEPPQGTCVIETIAIITSFDWQFFAEIVIVFCLAAILFGFPIFLILYFFCSMLCCSNI